MYYYQVFDFSSYAQLLRISYFLFAWVIGHLYHDTKVAAKIWIYDKVWG